MPKHSMSFSNYSVLIIACITLALVGCESKRYKPADWQGADNSTLTERGANTAVASKAKKRDLKRPDSPTNWMDLKGTGGEAIAPRSANGTLPSRYGTLPSRYGTLPARNGATSMPRRSGTSLPMRQGTSLPSRQGRPGRLGTSLPNRQNRNSAVSRGTTIPQRGRYRSSSTLPARN